MTTVGETANHHFSSLASQVWQVWQVDQTDHVGFTEHNFMMPHVFSSAPKYASYIGILPDVVESAPLPEQLWQQAVQNVFGDVGEQGGRWPSQNNLGDESAGIALSRVCLGNLARPVDGAVEHRFDSRGLLRALKFDSHLKPSARIGDALADASAMFFGDEGRGLSEDLRDDKYALPSLDPSVWHA